MLLELIIAIVTGILIGTITGLLPGIHINLVSAILLSLPFSLISSFSAVIFIVSLSITHTFVDFIPTIFLGAPDEDTSLSILPGHELLLQGEGHEAVSLSIIGSLIGIILLIPITFLFLIFLPPIYDMLKNIMPLILMLILFTMFFFEKKKTKTILIITLSGLLGIAVLSFNLNLKEPLLPMLTGLFGSSSLLLSISKKQKIPLQEIIPINQILKQNKSNFKKPILASLIASPICSFLPGLGSNQASTIGSYVIGELNKKQFLILIGIVNSLVMSLSFITLYSINKSRTGSAAYISKLIPLLTTNQIIILISSILITSTLIFIITPQLSKIFSKHISKINYNLLSIIILIFLSLIIISFSGFLGFLVFLVSTSLGISCILLNVRRTSLMACLLIPTIIYYVI